MSLQQIAPSMTIAVSAPSSLRAKSPWRLAILLAVVASASGILLTGISVWFLGAVALAGLGPAALAFNFHIPAALVRLFALSKTLGKYGERVVGHRAALLDQVKRRAKLFAAMALAPSTRAAGWQLGNQDRLSDYMEDVEDVDYERLRVGMPSAILVAGVGALAVATAWLSPLALVPIALLSLALAETLRRLMPFVDRIWRSVRSSQRSAGRLLGTALASVVPLQAERAFPDILNIAFTYFGDAEAGRLAQRRALAMLDMLAGLAGPLAALSVLVAAWHAGARDSALLVPAFLGFGWLALGETAHSVSRMVLGRVRERVAREGLDDWSTVLKTTPAPSPAVLQNLTLQNVPRQTPDGRSLGRPINLNFGAGRPTALVGASGTGKTTLLKQIAGWIGADNNGQFVGDGLVMLGAYRRAASHLCLHDAAILSDTVRENLFAATATDEACWLALAAVELDGRFADGLDSWISQDMLSLGEAQRLNLARALLNDAPIVVLDEPVEHLDFDQAARILKRILSQLANRVVIYSSHAEYAVPGTVSVRLGTDRELA
ncbi:ATP-binding cassette domain-containing protein [Bradyrhizobium erythrophlei]|uniref:ABC-type transport system involved in cytochrome bd biosynthesis, fused ATPase and permease components n=1 Tax=Bradyrhizobium erythrophlei TaxID=1437360 RepID=A0A1M5K5G6_9BRAD|nr:ATP-binding cassette domain-containing protein [Bradyrhizobium erythrophlei]SHG48082.1 ABC-type transport system involved in cytochrome bd biosynthesis, fused ATPase and permease components [Bradyrhizobium erythrophlei]